MFLTVNLQQDKSKLSSYLSNTLLSSIDETLQKGEKVLLYLNKRGSYSSLICEDCQHLFECPNCDTSLSVHSNPEHLRCHICNNAYNIPLYCSKCKGTKLKSIGVGTQQIERLLKEYYQDKISLHTQAPQSGILSPLEEKGAAASHRKYELKSPGYVFELAKGFQANPTTQEKHVWDILRGNKINNLKFRRQHPIGRYIADFYCDEMKLILELDGKIHETNFQKEYDSQRDELIHAYGYTILRLENLSIDNKTDKELKKYLEEKTAALLSSKGEEIQRGGGSMEKDASKKVHIYRFDSDAMKNISSKREALGELEKSDIIIGTKMITTGFDFDNIGLIGILLVEGELAYPSYDAEEKAYSNLRQLIGRGNRKSQKTQIVLQTFIPKNPLLLRLTQSNFKDFFSQTLQERKEFLYPPYHEMVTLEYRNKDSKKSLAFTEKLEKTLREHDPENLYQILRGGSTFKKNNSHHATLIVKGDNIRGLLKSIEKIILRESGLSVIFH